MKRQLILFFALGFFFCFGSGFSCEKGNSSPPVKTKGKPTSMVSPACKAKASIPGRDVTVAQLQKWIKAKAKLVVVDVREPSETARGIIAGASLMPWGSGKFAKQFAKLPKDKPIYIICASGWRSARAYSFLMKKGYRCTYNVPGGMYAWRRSGYPMVKK